jgi:hypothetical protein
MSNIGQWVSPNEYLPKNEYRLFEVRPDDIGMETSSMAKKDMIASLERYPSRSFKWFDNEGDPEADKKGYERAIIALRAWVKDLQLKLGQTHGVSEEKCVSQCDDCWAEPPTIGQEEHSEDVLLAMAEQQIGQGENKGELPDQYQNVWDAWDGFEKWNVSTHGPAPLDAPYSAENIRKNFPVITRAAAERGAKWMRNALSERIKHLQTQRKVDAERIAALEKERGDYRTGMLRFHAQLDTIWNMPDIGWKNADWIIKRVCEIQREAANTLKLNNNDSSSTF